MKYFYDTEFNEDGKTIDFISIGMVAEDGREYYAVSNEFDTRRVAQNDWLMDNVMPSIEHQAFVVSDHQGMPLVRDIYVTDKDAKSKANIAWDIKQFIGTDRAPELWAWYGAYDHVCLAQLWGRMLDLPSQVPMFTNDLKTLVKLAGNVRTPEQSAGNHNALADARHNVVRYNYLMEKLNGLKSSS
jgi:hypothetical protein